MIVIPVDVAVDVIVDIVVDKVVVDVVKSSKSAVFCDGTDEVSTRNMQLWVPWLQIVHRLYTGETALINRRLRQGILLRPA